VDYQLMLVRSPSVDSFALFHGIPLTNL